MNNRWSISNQAPLQQSRHKQEIDNSNVPNNQPAHHVKNDEQVRQLCQKDSPIPSENRSRIKSSYDIAKSSISQKYEKTETSYSPIIKSNYQRDISPQFQKNENHKLLDSYEVRLMKLSQENGQLQSQLFSDQQKYNQIIIDFELQTKCLEQKLHTEIMNIQQHKLLIQNKNEEINASTQELLRLEQKYFDLESKMFQQQKDMGILKQSNDSKIIEIDNLRQYIKELQTKNIRDQEELKLATDSSIRINYELQIKEIQVQHGNNIARLNDLLQQEQQKYNRLLNQFEQQMNELNYQNIKLNDLKIEKDKLFDENAKLQRFLEEIKVQQLEFLRESDSQRDRQMQQDKNHQNTLNELKSHYEYMKKSQVEREVKEVTIKFQADKLNYESQIRSLNQRLIEFEGKINLKNEENRQLQQKQQAIESELRIFVQDHEHYKRIKESELQEYQNEFQKFKQLQFETQQKNQNQQNEIQRLNQIINDFKTEIDLVKSQSQEIQKQFLIEYEDDLKNQKLKQQYEIKQLQDLINELKNQNQQQDLIIKQKDEIVHQQKLNVSQKQGEIDGLTLKLENLEKLKDQEIHQYQSEIENLQREQHLSLNKLTNEKSLLEQQIKQLKQKLNDFETQQIQQEFNKEQERQELQQKLQQKEFQLQQFQNEKNSISSQLTVYKQKIEQFDQIISELREQNQQINQEIEDQKQQNESDRAQFVKKELGLENKIQQLKQQINQREQELQQYLSELDTTNNRVRQQELITQQSQDEFRRREHQYVQEITNLKQLMDTTQQRQSEYQSMRETLQEQVQSLQEKSQNKEKEVEEQQQKYEDLREQFNQYVEETNTKLEYYQTIEYERKESDLKYQAELNAAQDKIRVLEIELETLQLRQNQLLKERRELEDLLDEKSKEIESLKNQLNKDYISNEEYTLLQKKYNEQTDELHLLEQKQIKFGTEKKQLERQIDKLNQDIELKDQELLQTDNLMKKRRSEQDELNRKIDQLTKDYSKVSHDLLDVQAQLSTKNDQINALKRENEDLQIQLASAKKQYEKTQEQLNKKNQELLEKFNDAEIKKSYSSGENTATKVLTATTIIKTSQVQLNTPLIPEEESQKGTERSDQQFKVSQKSQEF
ncbi:unnamed protein product [Paramecium pentaurelia]|uniref:Uncharacterized protein n=1 Tax=Paramecium pentaurelia TaxID=43138 RepID=A0A8S1WBN5_9CILI|nr:unnamed protein product [Paramecium pentaurelia]